MRAIEATSSAEVVVEIRSRSGSYSHANARFGALGAFAVLLFILFSPWDFDPLWVPGLVLLAYSIAMFVSMKSDVVRRWMTSRRERDAKIRDHAAAAFVERGVANTEEETGVLVYLSLLERRIEIVADRRVLDAVPVLEWNQFLESARGKEGNEETLTDVLRPLQQLLARCLPARDGDRNELSNDIRVQQ